MAAPSPHNLDLFHLQVYDYFVWLTKQRTSAATGRLRGQRLGESIVAAMEEEFPELVVSHSVNMERTPFLLLAVQHYSRQWHQQVVRSTTTTATSTGTNSTATADGLEPQPPGRKRSRRSMEDTGGGTANGAAGGSTGRTTTHPLTTMVLSPSSKKATTLDGWEETVLIRERPRRACRTSSPSATSMTATTKSPPKTWADHYREAVDFCTRYPAIKYITRERNPTLHHWLEEQNTQLSLQPEFDATKKKQLEQLHLENLAALKQPTPLTTTVLHSNDSTTAPAAGRSKSGTDPLATTTAATTTTATMTKESNAVWLQKFDKVQRLEAQGRPLTESLLRWIEENRAAITAAETQAKTTSNTRDFAAWKHKLNLLKTLAAWSTLVSSTTTATTTADPSSKSKSKPSLSNDRSKDATSRAAHHAILDTPSTTNSTASKKKTRTSSSLSPSSTTTAWTPNDTTIPRKATLPIHTSLPQSDTKKTTRSSVAAAASVNNNNNSTTGSHLKTTPTALTSSKPSKTPDASLVDTPDAPKPEGIKKITRSAATVGTTTTTKVTPNTQPTATTTTATTPSTTITSTPNSMRKDPPKPAPSTTPASTNLSQKAPFNTFPTTRTVSTMGGTTNTGNTQSQATTTSTMLPSTKSVPMQSPALQSQPSTQQGGNKLVPLTGGATTSLPGNGGQPQPLQQSNVPVNNFAQAPVAAAANFQGFPSAQVMPMDPMMRSNVPYHHNNVSQPMPQQQMQGAVVNLQRQQLAWQQQQQQQQQQRYLQQNWQPGAFQQAGPWNNHHGQGGK